MGSDRINLQAILTVMVTSDSGLVSRVNNKNGKMKNSRVIRRVDGYVLDV